MSFYFKLNKKEVKYVPRANGTKEIILPKLDLSFDAPKPKRLVVEDKSVKIRYNNKVLKKDCLDCSRQVQCHNPNKGYQFICDDYKERTSGTDIFSMPDFMDEATHSNLILPPKLIKSGSMDMLKTIRVETQEDMTKLLERIETEFASGLPRDLKIDDRDLPLAKNFVDWSYNPVFCGNDSTPPFAKHIEIIANFFSEICYNPKCTKVEYARSIPLNDTIDDILANVTFMEYGICPKCHMNRLEMWENKEYGVKRYNEMMGVGGQRCIVGSSRVLTTRGIIRIASLSEDKYGFSKYDGPELIIENGLPVKATKFYKGKPEYTRKIELNNGFNIEGTDDHPLMTYRDFIELKNLTIGENIPIYVGQNVWNEYGKSVDCDTARLLGFWVAEGSGRKDRIDISNANIEVIKFCKVQLSKICGKENVSLHPDKRNKVVSIQVKQKKFVNLFSDLVDGIERKSASKRIPDHILQSPRNIVSAFMQALYEGDGYLVNKHGDVGYTTISPILSNDISAVLSNFGIFHSIRKRNTWATNGSVNQVEKVAYEIIIEGYKAVLKFKQSIGFFAKRKSFELQKAIGHLATKQLDMPYWYDKFPLVIKNEFLDILNEINENMNRYSRWYDTGFYAKLRQDINYSIKSFFDINSDFNRIYSDNVSLSKQRLTRYFNTITQHKLWHVLDETTKNRLLCFYNKYNREDVCWVNVKSITVSDTKKITYDFYIPGSHRFIANGLLNHNSGKTAGVNRIDDYHAHRMLKLNRPQRVWGIEDNKFLEFSFTSTTFQKAKKNLYDPLYFAMQNNPWFRSYRVLLDDYGKRHGEELYKILNEVILFRHRGYMFYPESPDPQNMRGATRIGACIDEVSHLYTKTNDAIKLNPDEVYNSLSNSLSTLNMTFPKLLKEGLFDIPGPIMCNISSPRSYNDIGMRKLRQSQAETSRIYGFHYCLPGDTYIPTNNGLLRIDEIANGNKTKKINIEVSGSHKPVKASHWHYSGKKETRNIITKSGHIISPSLTHPVKVLSHGVHVWKKVSDLKKGDLLCLNPIQITRKAQLNLNLVKIMFSCSKSTHVNVKYPLVMTPRLAYLLGAIIAEGCFWSIHKKNTGFISVYNNNKSWLEYLSSIIKSEFGINSKIVEHLKEGYVSSNGIKNNGVIYKLYICSYKIYDILLQLGLSNKSTSMKRASWFKVIPWCILQADYESQASFIAAYIEADGWIDSDRKNIGIYSRSKTLLKQMQLLLDTHGIFSNLKGHTLDMFSSLDACNLYKELLPFLKIKLRKNVFESGQRSRLYGFPIEPIRTFFKSRKQPRKISGQFINDKNETVELIYSKGVNKGYNIVNTNRKLFTYEAFDEGLYDNLFKDLKLLSADEYNKVYDIVKHRYRYDPIVFLSKGKEVDTYDLTIEKGKDPAFIANGFIVHNSVYDFNPLATSEKETIEYLEEMKRTNPEGFRRDFLAIPPNAANAFIEDRHLVKSCIMNNLFNAVHTTVHPIAGPHRDIKMLTADFKIRADKKVNKEVPKILSLDAGESDNSFAMILAHLELDIDDVEDTETMIKVVDAVIEVIPRDERKINFTALYEDLIAPMIEEMNVVFVCADRWNSSKILTDIGAEFEIPWDKYSLKYKDFLAFKAQLYSGNLKFPMSSMKVEEAFELATRNYPLCFDSHPVAHLQLQMLTVQNLMNKSIVKGDGYTDDIFRALVLASHWMDNEEIQTELLAPYDNQVDTEAGIGVLASYGGSTISVSGGAVSTTNTNNSNGVIAGVGAYKSYSPIGQ